MHTHTNILQQRTKGGFVKQTMLLLTTKQTQVLLLLNVTLYI